MQNYKLDIDAIPGERWFPKETSFTEDLNEYWGDWGVCSEVDTLKAVLMRRPGKEVEKFDAQAVRFSDEPIDVELLRKQHDAVAKIYTDFGAKVYYVDEQRADRPNAIFCRDLVFMTPEGAILARPGMSARRGEERYVAQTLVKDWCSNCGNHCGRWNLRGSMRNVGRSPYCNSFNRIQVQCQRLCAGKIST